MHEINISEDTQKLSRKIITLDRIRVANLKKRFLKIEKITTIPGINLYKVRVSESYMNKDMECIGVQNLTAKVAKVTQRSQRKQGTLALRLKVLV